MDKANSPSIRTAYEFAWGIYKENFGLLVACMLTLLASWVILEVIVVAGQWYGVILWLIAHVSFFIIFAGLEIGFIRLCLALHDGGKAQYSDLFHELRNGVKFLIVQLAYFSTVLIGSVLLIVPGGYLGTKFTFHAYFFLEGNPTLNQSFKKSANLSQNSMWFLFWFSALIFLFNLVGASILGIGLILTFPLSILMKVHIYRQLNNKE